MNVATFITFGIDKWKSHKNKWRIPEKTLMLMTLLGGSVGAICAMQVWHHKTLHAKFKYGVPAILLLHVFLILWSILG